MRFEPSPAGEPPARDLLAAMVAEMNALYQGTIDAGPGISSATPVDLGPPGGACLVGYDGARPVAVGGIKRLDAACAEIKRMYVVPEARGGGAGRALLAALEDAARALGYRCARLDTGARQPRVRALFEAAGYRSIPDYNGNRFAAWWGEHDL